MRAVVEWAAGDPGRSWLLFGGCIGAALLFIGLCAVLTDLVARSGWHARAERWVVAGARREDPEPVVHDATTSGDLDDWEVSA